jgi:quercetin dioxygenase-like cupin family protein
MKQGKQWGFTTQVLQTQFCEVHALEIIPNAYCSKHKHNHKYNLFYVISGELIIKVWKGDQGLVDETLLQKGEWTIVKPGDYHQFETRSEGCECLEVYFPEGISEDIVRETVGGLKTKTDTLRAKTIITLENNQEEFDG